MSVLETAESALYLGEKWLAACEASRKEIFAELQGLSVADLRVLVLLLATLAAGFKADTAIKMIRQAKVLLAIVKKD